VCMYVNVCAMVRAVSHRPLDAEARIRSWCIPCETGKQTVRNSSFY